MATWQIGESGTAIALDGSGRGEVTFTVTNASAGADRAVLTVTPLDGAADAWFTVPEPQRSVAAGASVVYPVGVLVPATMAAGTYAMQGVAYSADRDPGESSVTSKRVSLTVGAPPPPKGVPKWILLVVAAVMLLVTGVVAFLLLRGGDDDPGDPAPLTNSAAPRISGPVALGETLTASPGSWSTELDGASFRWLRCTGGNCQAVPGSDTTTYRVTGADVDHSVRVEVTATAGDAEETTGSGSTPIVPPLTATELPELEGGLRMPGQTVTMILGGWSRPVVDTSVHWQRCDPALTSCTPIAGAIGTAYVLTEADVSHAVHAEVTASLAGATGQRAHLFRVEYRALRRHDPPRHRHEALRGRERVAHVGASRGNRERRLDRTRWLRRQHHRSATCTRRAGLD